MKLLKILIPLLLLVFVLAPGITGFLVEKSVDQEPAALTEAVSDMPVKMSFLSSDIDRGWFGSDHTAELSFNDPGIAEVVHEMMGLESAEDLPTLLVESKAAHGVLPMASPSKGGMRPAMAQAESKIYLKYPSGEKVALPLTVYSNSGGWTKLVAEPFSKEMNDGRGTAKLNFAGGTIEASVGDTISYDGELGKLTISSDEADMDISPIKLSGEFSKGDYAFAEGKGDLEVASAKMQLADGTTVGIDNARADSRLDVNNGRAVSAATLTSGKISLPGFAIDSTDMALSYDFDAEALSNVYGFMQSAGRDGQQPPDPSQMMGPMMDLLSKGGNINIEKLDVSLDGSAIHLDLNFDVPPGHTDPMSAMRSAKGAGNIIIPESVVELLTTFNPDIAGGIQMGTGMGFIEKKGDQYSAAIQYENGVLTVNGLPLPMPF